MVDAASTTDVPEWCSACGTEIPRGRTRCPGCGKVFGEDNRCPHCFAISAVRAKAGGYECAACGQPRERKSGTVVLGASAAPPTGVLARTTAGSAVRTTALRAFGIITLGVAVLVGTFIAAVAPGVSGIAIALAIAGVLVAIGALALRGASGEKRRAERDARKKHQAAILELAERSGGILTVTDVARTLGLSLDDAEAELTAMVDGSRVSMEVSPEGLVRYEFRELAASTFPMSFRVEDAAADTAIDHPSDAANASASRTMGRERK